MDKHVEEWVNNTINDMNPLHAEYAKYNILRVGDELSANYNSCTERVIRSLFVINAGGIIAILTYIHQDKLLNIKFLLKASLTTFVIGLALAFIVVILDYLILLDRCRIFKTDTKKFLSNEISFSDIKQSRDKNIGNANLWIGIASTVSAILGMAFGLCGYFL